MEDEIVSEVELPGALLQRVDELAKEMQVSRSELITLALKDFIARLENQNLPKAINEAVRHAWDEDDDSFLSASASQMMRVAGSESNLDE